VGEDDAKRREEALEKLTHEYTGKIDEMLKRKETEVLAI
jgi:ribosome recycling factor